MHIICLNNAPLSACCAQAEVWNGTSFHGEQCAVQYYPDPVLFMLGPMAVALVCEILYVLYDKFIAWKGGKRGGAGGRLLSVRKRPSSSKLDLTALQDEEDEMGVHEDDLKYVRLLTPRPYMHTISKSIGWSNQRPIVVTGIPCHVTPWQSSLTSSLVLLQPLSHTSPDLHPMEKYAGCVVSLVWDQWSWRICVFGQGHESHAQGLIVVLCRARISISSQSSDLQLLFGIISLHTTQRHSCLLRRLLIDASGLFI